MCHVLHMLVNHGSPSTAHKCWTSCTYAALHNFGTITLPHGGEAERKAVSQTFKVLYAAKYMAAVVYSTATYTCTAMLLHVGSCLQIQIST